MRFCRAVRASWENAARQFACVRDREQSRGASMAPKNEMGLQGKHHSSARRVTEGRATRWLLARYRFLGKTMDRV